MTEFISRKRDGLPMEASEYAQMISDFLAGDIPDYQMAAWLMAVFFRGMEQGEISAFTQAMWKSGSTLTKKNSGDLWVDKHSTGGVGDKTSLLLVPWVWQTAYRLRREGRIGATVRIPMISGRGLGFTGGTLDKLESVPGFRAELPLEEALQRLERNGFFVIGQTKELAPADRRIYALRDVTSTVESIPLITASILSKKFSAGLDALVLDIKVGRGSFNSTIERARSLADTLISVCDAQGVRAVAVLTDMDEPLGAAIGHRIEVEECHQFLSGQHRDPGLLQVTLELATQMLWMAGKGSLSTAEAREVLVQDLESGVALSVFERMLEFQGGDLSRFWESRRQVRRSRRVVNAGRSGWVRHIDARALAGTVHRLGGGRTTAETPIDHDVGIWIAVNTGQRVEAGEPLAWIEGGSDTAGEAEVAESFVFSDTPIVAPDRILEVRGNR